MRTRNLFASLLLLVAVSSTAQNFAVRYYADYPTNSQPRIDGIPTNWIADVRELRGATNLPQGGNWYLMTRPEIEAFRDANQQNFDLWKSNKVHGATTNRAAMEEELASITAQMAVASTNYTTLPANQQQIATQRLIRMLYLRDVLK